MEPPAINLAPLTRDEAMRVLKAHEPQLRAEGVLRLAAVAAMIAAVETAEKG